MVRLIDANALKTAITGSETIISMHSEPIVRNTMYILDGVNLLVDAQPTIDAIPVEWLEAQIKPYTGDVSDIGKTAQNGTIKNIIRKWQKEREKE